MYYILINENGIEVKESSKNLSLEQMQRLVGIPGEDALTEVVGYNLYSDHNIKMIIDDESFFDERCRPTCRTSEDNDQLRGQILVMAVDPDNGELGLLTEAQVEVVQRETTLCQCQYYALINEEGIKVVEADKLPSLEERENLVGVPGVKTSAIMLDLPDYSDPTIRKIVEDRYELNQQCHPTCQDSEGCRIDGQVLVLAIDQNNLKLLTSAQVEIVKKETTLLYGGYARYWIK